MKGNHMYTLKRATSITSQTLVGYIIGDYPQKNGNCFSVRTKDKEYRIVNFNVENLEYLLENKKITFPIIILPITDRHAYIHDERIEDDWYSNHICEVCCPSNLLPLPQRLRKQRAIRRKDITITRTDDYIIESRTIKPKNRRIEC